MPALERQRLALLSWPAKPAYLVNPRPVSDPVSKSKSCHLRNGTEADLCIATYMYTNVSYTALFSQSRPDFPRTEHKSQLT